MRPAFWRMRLQAVADGKRDGMRHEMVLQAGAYGAERRTEATRCGCSFRRNRGTPPLGRGPRRDAVSSSGDFPLYKYLRF
jgi:hypothetical protein